MTNSTGKLVVFSAPCSDGEYLPVAEAAMQVEVSKVTTVPRPILLEDLEKAKEIIDNSKDVLDSSIDLAKTILDRKDLDGALDAIQGLGDILKGIFKFIPEPENPLVKNLETLENMVKKLEEKMIEHFSEMKVFMGEVKFFVKIINPTSVLMKHMRDCIKNPGPEAVKNYERAYYRHSPMSLALTLISYLEQKSINPLRLAMENEKTRSAETCKKWEKIICDVLGKFMLLQAFSNGILKLGDKFNCDTLYEEIMGIIKTIRDWKEEFEVDYYWDEVKDYLEKYIVTHEHLNNHEKANEIQEKMKSFLTNDSFYISVFNQCEENVDFSYYCPQMKTQLIKVVNKGNCNAFIYRSRKANKKSTEDYKKYQEELLSKLQEQAIDHAGTFNDSFFTKHFPTGGLSATGFIGIIDGRKNIAERNANCFVNKRYGPGCSIDLKFNSISYTTIASFD